MKQAPTLALLLAVVALWLTGCASQPTQADASSIQPRIPEQVSNAAWEADIQRFEAADASAPPATGGVLFIGSSSIRFWDSLTSDFPGIKVINRGFGGSQIRDSTWYANRIVIPYQPRVVVMYCGDNDIYAGRSPQQVRDDFLAFVKRVHKALPRTRIVFISIKPSPSRAALMPQMAQANALIAAEAARQKLVQFVDVYTPMLDASGNPRTDLFRADALHMNQSGYALWRDELTPVISRR